jgi:hypothetical protein
MYFEIHRLSLTVNTRQWMSMFILDKETENEAETLGKG